MSWSALLQSLLPIYGPVNNICLYRVVTSNEYGIGVIVKQTACDSATEAQQVEDQSRIPHCPPHPSLPECLGSTHEPIPGGAGYYAYTFWPPMSESLHDDLKRRIVGEAWTFYTEDELWKVYWQLLEVFSYLQECNIAHRDIKPASIMKDAEGNWRLYDFQSAKEIDSSNPSDQTLPGKPYMSPALRKACIDHKSIIHDQFKSDVYSLGVVLLHLSLLEVPEFLTYLINLQQNIDTALDKLKATRSEQWVAVLKRMLTVDENSRPDFRLLLSSSSFDDEYLQGSLTLLAQPLELSVKCGLESVRVSAQHVDEVACVLTVSAVSRTCALDLVCVVDQSGSVDEGTFDLVKMALLSLLEKLSDQDRLSLVCFSDNAEKKCPLVRCDVVGKKKISAHIKILQTQDLTNMTAGFLLGIKVLKERKYKNQACTLLLFTDDQPNVGDSPSPTCQQALTGSGLEPFTLNCFALGEHLTFPLLEELARYSGGNYCRLTSVDQLEQAVNKWPSVVARDLRVTWKGLEGVVQCEIIKVYSSTGTSDFSLPSISTNERIDRIFIVKPRYGLLPTSGRCPAVQADLAYTDNEGIHSSRSVVLDIKFVKWGSIPPQQDAEVYLKLHRAKGTEFLQEAERLENEGLFKQAEEYVQGAIEAMETQYAEDEEVVAILKQLRQVRDDLTN